MTQCPKCGSCSVSGPVYECSSTFNGYHFSGERLRYTCCRCGYSKTVPCLDSADRQRFTGDSIREARK